MLKKTTSHNSFEINISKCVIWIIDVKCLSFLCCSLLMQIYEDFIELMQDLDVLMKDTDCNSLVLQNRHSDIYSEACQSFSVYVLQQSLIQTRILPLDWTDCKSQKLTWYFGYFGKGSGKKRDGNEFINHRATMMPYTYYIYVQSWYLYRSSGWNPSAVGRRLLSLPCDRNRKVWGLSSPIMFTEQNRFESICGYGLNVKCHVQLLNHFESVELFNERLPSMT